MENYEKISEIGKGSFGSVSKIKRKSDGRILVWKELNYGKMSEKEKQQLVSEVNILRELRHPNIVRYYDRIIDKERSRIYIIMEYCEQGDMAALIKRCKKQKQNIPEEMAWKILAQMTLALFECHRRKEGKILHRDLKPGNVFIDSQSNVKLGDFGLSRIMGDQSVFAYTHVGTPYYMSPEQIMEQKYNHKSDIWSAGCVVYEIVSLRAPFEATNQIQLAQKIKKGEIERIPSMYSEQLFQILKSMIEIEQDKRPSCEDLMKNPKICFFIRALRLREMEQNVKRKEEEVKAKNDQFKIKEQQYKEQLQTNQKEINEDLIRKIKESKELIFKLQQEQNIKQQSIQSQEQQMLQLENKLHSKKKQNEDKNRIGSIQKSKDLMMETFGRNMIKNSKEALSSGRMSTGRDTGRGNETSVEYEKAIEAHQAQKSFRSQSKFDKQKAENMFNQQQKDTQQLHRPQSSAAEIQNNYKANQSFRNSNTNLFEGHQTSNQKQIQSNKPPKATANQTAVSSISSTQTIPIRQSDADFQHPSFASTAGAKALQYYNHQTTMSTIEAQRQKLAELRNQVGRFNTNFQKNQNDSYLSIQKRRASEGYHQNPNNQLQNDKYNTIKSEYPEKRRNSEVSRSDNFGNLNKNSNKKQLLEKQPQKQYKNHNNVSVEKQKSARNESSQKRKNMMIGEKMCSQNIIEELRPRDTHVYKNERNTSNQRKSIEREHNYSQQLLHKHHQQSMDKYQSAQLQKIQNQTLSDPKYLKKDYSSPYQRANFQTLQSKNQIQQMQQIQNKYKRQNSCQKPFSNENINSLNNKYKRPNSQTRFSPGMNSKKGSCDVRASYEKQTLSKDKFTIDYNQKKNQYYQNPVILLQNQQKQFQTLQNHNSNFQSQNSNQILSQEQQKYEQLLKYRKNIQFNQR